MCSIDSDINEHLPTLKLYASECKTVTEMGVRFACSTWAFIEAKPKNLTCIDIDYSSFEPSDKYVRLMCDNYGINFNWITGDSLKLDMENTDLLFIDTLHTYKQLLGELNRYESKVSKYIILHDTTTFGHRNEDIYEHSSDIIKNEEVSKFGLIPAMDDFLLTNKSWVRKEVYSNNNGLTILKRI
jgi:cephalosporin hydroxylase